MRNTFVIAALLASVAGPALATGNNQNQNQQQNQGQSQSQAATGIGIGIGKGGRADSNSASTSNAFSGSASSAAGGTGGNASVQGGSERTQYDSFAFGYAAPGLSIHNNGVYGDETVTTPYGFQVPAIGGGYNGTDVEPTVGFVWRNIDAFQAAYFEPLDATPADRDRAEFRRAFVCAYIPKLADQLTKVSPYRCQ